MSPNCCEKSTQYKTVTLFVPASQSSPSHWAAPFRGDDEKVAANGVTQVFYCPFCGAAIGREHLPFERTATLTKGSGK